MSGESPPPMERIESHMSTASRISNISVSSTMKKRNPVDFQFGKLLGEGSFSTVYLATEKSTQEQFAVKVLDKHHIVKERKTKYVKIEKDVLHRLNHPLCVKLYYTFQDSSSLYFVLEYCENKDILDLLKANGRFNRENSLFYISEVLEAVRYIHSCHVLHRDLKPENILIAKDFHIKITDFGSAKIVNTQALDNTELVRKHSFVGTAEYCSPELLDHKGTTYASDVWAIGCIFYQFLVGMPPFKAGSEYLTFQKVLHLEYTIPKGLDSDIVNLLQRILILNPEDRIPIKDIIGSDIFKEVDFQKLHLLTPPKMQYLDPLAKYVHEFEPDEEEQDIEMTSPGAPRNLLMTPLSSPAVKIGNSAESVDDEEENSEGVKNSVSTQLPTWLPKGEGFTKFGVMRKVILL